MFGCDHLLSLNIPADLIRREENYSIQTRLTKSLL